MPLTRFLAILSFALAGCHFTPSPTNKAVTTNDVVGIWSFTENYGNTTVNMTFMPSGIFTQQVINPTATNMQLGKWSLNGPHLNLTDFLAQVGQNWGAASMHWYLIDGDERPLVIFGGAFPDPDSFQHLKFVGTVPSE